MTERGHGLIDTSSRLSEEKLRKLDEEWLDNMMRNRRRRAYTIVVEAFPDAEPYAAEELERMLSDVWPQVARAALVMVKEVKP